MASQIERKRIEEIIREEVANLDEGFREEIIRKLTENKKLNEQRSKKREK